SYFFSNEIEHLSNRHAVHKVKACSLSKEGISIKGSRHRSRIGRVSFEALRAASSFAPIESFLRLKGRRFHYASFSGISKFKRDFAVGARLRHRYTGCFFGLTRGNTLSSYSDMPRFCPAHSFLSFNC